MGEASLGHPDASRLTTWSAIKADVRGLRMTVRSILELLASRVSLERTRYLTASVVIRGHAFVQNLRRGHFELAVDASPVFRPATAFVELRPAV